ncbi:MAG TPA: MBOAT family protein [Gemmatimonadaceae bacterium]|jgi:D-alanyl-lipoteichoic acid acyltransferase DltB (MBOAT superfamily)|nr:MBOAT family protein [Gemmatimonadaceae bacterium]
MLFNSLQFALFFPIVTLLYFALPHRWRGALLLAASCVFYMAFVPAYILILAVTILIDYAAGIGIARSTGRRRTRWLVLSIVSTCAVLFVFKYFDFFNASIAVAARAMGMAYAIPALGLLLPVGLSFHTFQSLSYVIEVYAGRQEAERDFGRYALYVMFYPQLVAGPIERPQNLLHQFREEHRFDYDRVVAGLQLMAWGFVKKVVVADRLADLVNRVYDAPRAYTGIPLWTATIAFAFQIYCDFSGYSDIAIGSAQVMGFSLMRNFDRPYAARSISEFWRRWHVSLSTWFRDYVYVPLGGNRVARSRWYANLLVTFLVSGLWHGARWTFVVWGALHGAYLVAGLASAGVRARVRDAIGLARSPAILAAWQTSATFALVTLGWVFFRAGSLADAWYVLSHLGTGVPAQLTALAAHDAAAVREIVFLGFEPTRVVIAATAVAALLAVERWQGASTTPLRARLAALHTPFRWAAYAGAVLTIMTLGVFHNARFIYFQF